MNKGAHVVRHRTRAGAGDRRVGRTRRALTHALIDLVREKRYDAITVQDLLDRADVGRSTFYSHYRGKDDLLLRSFQRMLELLDQALERDRTAGGRMAPVRELFRHVGEFRSFHQALARARMIDRLYERRLAAVTRADQDVPLTVKARVQAGALFALLRWWVESESRYSPEQMDQMYHAMPLTS
jgi:AcrR family transcriptional regulator